MRLRTSLVVVSLLLAACGANSAVAAGDRVALAQPDRTSRTGETTPLSVEAAPLPRPVWQGFERTTGAPNGLTAVIHGPTDVFDSPTIEEPRASLEPTTILGTTTVLAVVGGPEAGRFEVMLPVRPNGSTGWIDGDALSFYIADGEIRIDLSTRELSYVVDGVEVLHTDIGVGSEYNQTPVGVFFVTDRVTVNDPNSPWGPHALGLSARSDTITEFNGGDGIIGIHGTNNPSSIGDNISLGCVRLPNDMITALHGMAPIGTRVTISA